MRSLAVAVLVISSSAAASPYDAVWAGMSVGMGPPQISHGDLGDRMERSHCGDGTCQLGGRMAIGGGYGHWGGELQVSVIPVVDTTPMTGGDRVGVIYGPQVRYSVARRWGFDVSARAGVGLGSFDRTVPRTETTCTGVDPPNCSTHDIDDGYSAVAASGGLSLAWRARFDGGYFALQADLDVTVVSAWYPDGVVTGLVTGRTFGIAFGSMFDVH